MLFRFFFCGEKRKIADMRRKMIQFACDPAMAEDLYAAAEKRGVSASEFVRSLVADALSKSSGRTYARLEHGGARRASARTESPSPGARPRSR